MKLFNPITAFLIMSVVIFNFLAFKMNRAFAFQTTDEMNIWLIQNQEKQNEYYTNVIDVAGATFPPQEIVEFDNIMIHDKTFDVYFEKYTIYNEFNPLDITAKQKILLLSFSADYPKTKRNLRKEENNNFAHSKAKYTCAYPDEGKLAIGYGDNEFLVSKPNVQCITREMAEWILHKQIHKRVIAVKNSAFYQKWHHKLGDDYLVGVYSKIYQWHPESFIKSNVYKLMLEDPFKNADKIAKEWVRWKQDFAIKRRQDEIKIMYNDRIFKMHLAEVQQKQLKQYKVLNDVLKEIGII